MPIKQDTLFAIVAAMIAGATAGSASARGFGPIACIVSGSVTGIVVGFVLKIAARLDR
jgi:hypothetical protein